MDRRPPGPAARRRAPVIARLLVALLAAVALAAAPVTAPAQTTTPTGAPANAGAADGRDAPAAPRTSLYEIEDQVMCVVCRTPLSVANGPQAEAQRELIRRLIAEGRTADEIKAALVDEYGERVLALPREDGFALAVYLVPIAVVAVALALAAAFLPRWRRRARARAAAEPAPLGPELSDDDARRLEEDLRRSDL